VLLVRPFSSKHSMTHLCRNTCTFPIAHCGCWHLERDCELCFFLFLNNFFLSVLFILQWWPIILLPALVLFNLTARGNGNCVQGDSLEVQIILRWTLQALSVLNNLQIFIDEAWCGRTALILVSKVFVLVTRTHAKLKTDLINKLLKQDRQYMCNVTSRRVHETIVAVEKQ
jgi:hypothetical protein